MKILSIYLDSWKTEWNQPPCSHMGPLGVTAATTLLIGMVWGKHQALSGACVAVIVYPLTRARISYLMFLDLHETVYAVAVVGIQLCSIRVPQLAQWKLLMSIALAYALTIRGMRIRQALQDQGTEISTLQGLNVTLQAQIDTLSDHTRQLKAALETLHQTLGLQSSLVQALDNGEREALCLQMKALTEYCHTLCKNGSLREMRDQIDATAQQMQKQAADFEATNEQLVKIVQKLHAAEAKFQELIQKAGQDADQVRACLLQFHEWLLQFNP
jgi:methyl-accepting chemotaxis protein